MRVRERFSYYDDDDDGVTGRGSALARLSTAYASCRDSDTQGHHFLADEGKKYIDIYKTGAVLSGRVIPLNKLF